MQKVKVEQAGRCSQASNIGYQLLHSLLQEEYERLRIFGSVYSVTDLKWNCYKIRNSVNKRPRVIFLWAQLPDCFAVTTLPMCHRVVALCCHLRYSWSMILPQLNMMVSELAGVMCCSL